ncbi:MAG: hypothetical protein ACXAB2_12660 [Candidatus Hodarchaeales archaeon]|jgi:hypothetical protein
MRYDNRNPLNGLKPLKYSILDAHVHIWNAEAYSLLKTVGERFSVRKFMGIAAPDVKLELENSSQSDRIIFAYYLPIDAFADHNPKKILDAVDEAYTENYQTVKMWFGPRFLDYFQAEKPFSINNPIFDPVFSLIEDYGLRLDIHIADPDVWYANKYLDIKRYRTKDQALNEFRDILRRHKDLRTISVHFHSLPENLKVLEKDLIEFSNLYIDTASTKWIIRELGKNKNDSIDFFEKYYKRILFATDISVGWEDRDSKYISTRYWSQRMFWESDLQNVELPFSDEDNPSPPTYINGLSLSEEILSHIYWNNASDFFS